MYPIGGGGRQTVESRAGEGNWQDRRGRSVQSGDPNQKASGIQDLGNHKGKSSLPGTLNSHTAPQ